ncbi:MAG: nucleotidyltransferase [Verrucomicrobia bacterium]|nr:nucleotidyltransferase [Verrucomicrobiota bacterium]MCG2681570.1 nucleotidyltransferase [Kiritimatiellia bacterium]MBU4248124.1 nucleotidyltransferase [Verrucomicrobiota bacterium]MBU4290652.1 nucleotidyltransferase [Verrucomicrobiota bacterium]MBU4430012.1 nucleotidyltransferase [Verrucomicrobiota bacterium]
MKPTLVVMAAGVGSRYGGLKQIDPVGPSGEIMLDYSVFDAIRAGFGKVVFIIRRDIEQDFKAVIVSHFAGRIPVDYVFQELANLPAGFTVPPDRKKPWGTGHAVLQCKDLVREPFAVINADDFYGCQSYAVIADYLQNLRPDGHDHAMVGFKLANTLSDHGSVTRGICETDVQGKLVSVAERFKIEKTASGARYENETGQWVNCRGEEIASMNLFGFTPALFVMLEEKFPPFLISAAGNPKAEFLLPAIVNTLIQERRITLNVLQTPEQWFGVTYKEDKPIVSAGIRAQIAAGVYPERLWS